MDRETQGLYKQALLGEEASSFLSDELGEYILARSKEEVNTAVEALKTVDPTDKDKISELQVKIQVAEKAVKWLDEMIILGHQAMELLEEGE